MSRGGHVIGAKFTPEEPPHRREPMIGYFYENYWGYSGDTAAAVELADMMRAGVKLTPELVDHVAKKHNIDAVKRFVQEHAPVPKPLPKPTNWVYFIRVEGRVKIGTSADPARRAVALSLRINNVHAVIEGDRTLERKLHGRFAEHRIDGTEWFVWCDEIEEFIDKYAERFTKDHRAYKPGAATRSRAGHAALLQALDIVG